MSETAVLDPPVEEVAESTDSPEAHAEGVDTTTEAQKASAEISAKVDPKVEELARRETESLNKLVARAVDLLDNRQALAKHASAGKQALEHAKLVKLSIRASWKGSDFDDIMAELKKRIRIVVPIDARPDDWVRAYCFVECIKPMVPGVTGLSYFQVINKLAPACLSFNKTDLEGSIKEGWPDKVRELVERQLSSTPMKMTELDAAIDEHKAALKAAKQSELTEAQLAKQAHKEAVAKETKAEMKARSGLSAAVTEAAERLKPTEIAAIIEKAGVALPSLGPNPASMTEGQALQFADLLKQAGNFKAIYTLHAALGKVIADFKRIAQEQSQAA